MFLLILILGLILLMYLYVTNKCYVRYVGFGGSDVGQMPETEGDIAFRSLQGETVS